MLASSLRRTLLHAVLAATALLLPGVAAQDPQDPATPTTTATATTTTTTAPTAPTASPTPSSGSSTNVTDPFDNYATYVTETGRPTAGYTAAYGAPTHAFKEPTELIGVILNTSYPAVVFDFDFDVTNAALAFNLVAEEAGFQAPRMLVSADPKGSKYYHPGTMYASPESGGTSTGGYNRRRETTYDVIWDQGFANWTYAFTLDQGPIAGHPTVRPSILIALGLKGDTAEFDPSLVPNVSVEVWIWMTTNFSDEYVSLSQLSPMLPLVGDSTATEALIFSPVLYSKPIEQPTYPNYTLPEPEMALPDWNFINETVALNSSAGAGSNFPFGRAPIYTLVMETENSPEAIGLANSYFALSMFFSAGLNTTALTYRGGNETEGDITQWMTIGGEQGFRYWATWFNLKPNTNYTVWAIGDKDTPILSRPTWFVTKTESFQCTLLPPSDVCPGVAYAVPFGRGQYEEPDVQGQPLVTAIPDDLKKTITANLASFETALSSSGLACGRDYYSFVSTCLDCANAYRDWLCHILLPRCVDPNAAPFQNTSGKNAPTAAFSVPRVATDARNGNATTYDFDFDEMLPCIGLCTAVERKCPSALQWVCPHRNFNAHESYAFITHDNKKNDGNANTGWPAQDVWGNRWCNMG